ncbi:adenosine deaminase isoform X1 [Nilaparvata lugens]|uniref:adenosine deaminase isoform X1 n=1 Tax=Nilaparvata lugens TaxID=108931 RepID=UPI00193CD888|nr:adenosine deaminase isoform X1 [Nilaparvata lugens]
MKLDSEQKRVELHVHLDGAIRHGTIYDLMRKNDMKLPGDGSFEALSKALTVTEPIDLANFLKPFGIYIQALKSLEAAERVAYEFSEEMSKNKVAYAEARYCPHNFLPENQKEVSKSTGLKQVVEAVTRGFTRGEEDFGAKVRSILVGFNGEDSVDDVLKLAHYFKGEGVVGIDMATKQNLGYNPEEVKLNSQAICCYEEARKCGIHRTLHAGESGGPEMVQRALEIFHAERIGHGYHTVEDEKLFQNCLKDRVHFETCPHSSILTGAVKLNDHKKHPIIRFAENDANFSISSDDPTVINKWVDSDYQLLQEWGLNSHHFKKANLNAAEACFLPQDEKAQLVETMKKLWT